MPHVYISALRDAHIVFNGSGNHYIWNNPYIRIKGIVTGTRRMIVEGTLDFNSKVLDSVYLRTSTTSAQSPSLLEEEESNVGLEAQQTEMRLKERPLVSIQTLSLNFWKRKNRGKTQA